jgi:hypothetical protein
MEVYFVRFLFWGYKRLAQLVHLFDGLVRLCIFVWNLVIQNWILNRLQSISSRLVLSPYRSFRYLFLMWAIGVCFISTLEKYDYLVLNIPQSDLVVSNGAELLMDSDKNLSNTDKPNSANNNTPNQLPFLLIKPNEKTIPIDSINLLIKDQGWNFIPLTQEISCKGHVNRYTYALDMILPVLKINASSQCTISKNANVFVHAYYVIYPIFGIILAGLTLFSWAGILQNRLSK